MDLTAQTSATLDEIKKAQTTGLTTGLGLTGVDLRGVISNIPVPASFYDKLAKTSPEQAGPYAIWRVLTNINNQQSNPATGFDYSAPLHKNSLLTVSSPYARLGYGYSVTKDAIALAKGFADAHAIEVYGAMNQYKIGADKLAIGGQNFALPTPSAPTVTPSATGGTIPATTAVPVKVSVRTGTGYFYGQFGIASAAGSNNTASGSTNSATATVPAVRGAVAYDWFVNNFYYTTTVVNKVTITAIPTANAASVPNLPGLSTVVPTAPGSSDGTANTAEFNGILATLAGDYAAGNGNGLVTAGNGITSGATFQSLDGAGFTGSGQNINELDNLNAAIWQNTYLSPSAYMCSSVDAAAISKLLLASAGGGTTFFTPGNDGRGDVTAGGFIGHYINKAAGGVPVRIEVHPNMVPGTLIARTDQVNFPNSGITNVFELRELESIQDFTYGVNRNPGVLGGGPRFDGEVYSASTLINQAPAAQAVLSNIQS